MQQNNNEKIEHLLIFTVTNKGNIGMVLNKIDIDMVLPFLSGGDTLRIGNIPQESHPKFIDLLESLDVKYKIIGKEE